MKSIYKNKRVISTIIVILLVISMIAGTTITVFADETKILTLGADLTDEQKQLIINYLGVDINDVEVITVNNEDEHHYLDGIVAEQTIGHRTYSCSYIEPTTEGGIHIKTVNLTYVDCDMIRNALITSGITNANVICVAPKEVSGTGAMVGIFKAYEHIESEDLDEEKIELATEELVTTLEISDEVGKEEANDMMTEIKELVIEKGKKIDKDEILNIIEKYLEEHNLQLTEEQKWKLVELLLKISQKDYDIEEIKQSYQDLKNTINKVQETAETTKNIVEKIIDFFKMLWQKITGTYEEIQENEKVKEITEQIGILAQTHDELLGNNTVVTNTDEEIAQDTSNSKNQDIIDSLDGAGNLSTITQEQKKGFFNSIVEFFKNLFNSTDDEETEKLIEEENTVDTSITFDTINETTEFEEGSTFEDLTKPEEENNTDTLQYVTHELQELEPNDTENSKEETLGNEKNAQNSNDPMSFDSITQK